ncbi:MAG: hemerythrin domain-containing protein [Myxococcales bacterium]
MNAIKLLEEQHREVEKLFEQFEKARTADTRLKLFETIADKLAAHAKLEELYFYPETKKVRTEDMLREAVEEHLAAKRIIADLLKMRPEDEQFEAKMMVLKEQVQHHVEEEEKQLFPEARKTFGERRLEELGAIMEQEALELEKTEPRLQVPNEIGAAAPIG